MRLPVLCKGDRRQLGDNWATTGRQLGDNWATTGRQLGDNWALSLRNQNVQGIVPGADCPEHSAGWCPEHSAGWCPEHSAG